MKNKTLIWSFRVSITVLVIKWLRPIIILELIYTSIYHAVQGRQYHLKAGNSALAYRYLCKSMNAHTATLTVRAWFGSRVRSVEPSVDRRAMRWDCMDVFIKAKMNIDTERLITEVHLRPELWDLSSVFYKDRDAKISAWQEVCKELIHSIKDSFFLWTVHTHRSSPSA